MWKSGHGTTKKQIYLIGESLLGESFLDPGRDPCLDPGRDLELELEPELELGLSWGGMGANVPQFHHFHGLLVKLGENDELLVKMVNNWWNW